MRSFQNLQQPTNRSLFVENESYLFLGGTAYLGLLDNPEYIQLYKEGIDKYGLNNGTSRSNNIQQGIYKEAEEKMALRFGFEDSALFSSGYLAAQAAVRALVEDREIIYAPGCHPALWLNSNPNINQVFEEWAIQTVTHINHSINKDFILISNCIDNLRPANYDFSVFEQIKGNKDVLFILDDSHGLGIVNKNAVSSEIDLLRGKGNLAIIVVSSLAKGLGTDAGIVLGSHEVIKKVKSNPIFLGASPASPAAIYALIHSDELYEASYNKLQQNIDYFVNQFPEISNLNYIERFPVFSSSDPDLYPYLYTKKILISSFPYPLATSPVLNRIVISALHRAEDLDYLSEIIFSKSE